jgi:integrase
LKRLAKGVSPHILRHTAITWATQAGAKTHDVAEVFGVSEKLIRSAYVRQHPDHQKGVADMIDLRNANRRPGPFKW